MTASLGVIILLIFIVIMMINKNRTIKFKLEMAKAETLAYQSKYEDLYEKFNNSCDLLVKVNTHLERANNIIQAFEYELKQHGIVVPDIFDKEYKVTIN